VLADRSAESDFGAAFACAPEGEGTAASWDDAGVCCPEK